MIYGWWYCLKQGTAQRPTSQSRQKELIALIRANFASYFFSFCLLINWKKLREIVFQHVQPVNVNHKASHVSSGREIANLLLSKVNLEQLLTFCMMWGFLFNHIAVISWSINEVKENRTPPFLSSHWDSVLGFHLIIFIRMPQPVFSRSGGSWHFHQLLLLDKTTVNKCSLNVHLKSPVP